MNSEDGSANISSIHHHQHHHHICLYSQVKWTLASLTTAFHSFLFPALVFQFLVPRLLRSLSKSWIHRFLGRPLLLKAILPLEVPSRDSNNPPYPVAVHWVSWLYLFHEMQGRQPYDPIPQTWRTREPSVRVTIPWLSNTSFTALGTRLHPSLKVGFAGSINRQLCIPWVL